MGKNWLQQLLAKAGVQSGFLKHCSDSSLFECWRNCSCSWGVDCIHLQSYFYFLNLGPCFSLWCAIQWQYLLFSAKWVPPRWELTHLCFPWFIAFGTPDWWSNLLSCRAAPGTTQQLLEEQWKNQPSINLPAQTDPTGFGSLPWGAPKWKNWWAEWCLAIANVRHQKTYTVTRYQTSSPQVNPYLQSINPHCIRKVIICYSLGAKEPEWNITVNYKALSWSWRSSSQCDWWWHLSRDEYANLRKVMKILGFSLLQSTRKAGWVSHSTSFVWCI